MTLPNRTLFMWLDGSLGKLCLESVIRLKREYNWEIEITGVVVKTNDVCAPEIEQLAVEQKIMVYSEKDPVPKGCDLGLIVGKRIVVNSELLAAFQTGLAEVTLDNTTRVVSLNFFSLGQIPAKIAAQAVSADQPLESAAQFFEDYCYSLLADEIGVIGGVPTQFQVQT